MRIAFVIPWYGRDVAGGAETECRALAHAVKRLRPDIEVEVLTTALRAFSHDWNANVHPEGLSDDEGVAIRRFNARPAKRRLFGRVNERLLMRQGVDDLWRRDRPRSPLPRLAERWYLAKMVHSPSLYAYLRANREAYDHFVFLPYMFGTTVRGSLAVPGKAVIVPCLHDERYAYMRLYRRIMRRAEGVVFLVRAEQRLANRLYEIPLARQLLLGGIVRTDPPTGEPARFRAKYGLVGPYVLCVGRKILGKNLPWLVDCFAHARAASPALRDVRLVLVGEGDLQYPADAHPGVVDLGYVPEEDKQDAYAGALALAQPSLNESFSIVMMEAWLQGTPCLVAARCEVTRDHVEESGGGLSFADGRGLAAALERLLADPAARAAMGARGSTYVRTRYARDAIVERFLGFLERLRGARRAAAPSSTRSAAIPVA